MKSVLKTLLIIFGALTASDAAAQGFCGSDTVEIFPGGYVVGKCVQGRDAGGVGTTLSDASTSAIDFLTLDAATGFICDISKSDVSLFPGGFKANFSCHDPNDQLSFGKAVSGIGTYATDAGINGLGWAEFFSATGKSCTGSASIFAGGYEAHFQCGWGDSYTGLGSTATDAANNALAIANLEGLWVSRGHLDVRSFPGGYEVKMRSADGRYVRGIGTSVTAASRDALANARAAAR